ARAHRHVVRALQHHRAVARPRLLSVLVGHLRADGNRLHDYHRQLCVVLPAVPRLHPGDALTLGGRGEGNTAAAHEGRRGWPPLRPFWASSPTWTRRCVRSKSCARRATTTSPCTPRCPSTRSRTCWSAIVRCAACASSGSAAASSAPPRR